jgi:short-chain Z-isoprenyl diphosphate synthase
MATPRDLVYRIYERQLANRLQGARLPRHVGVILDGNRRYARERGLSTIADGHRLGGEKVHELLDWCHELGIPYVTLWLLSTENLQRDAQEVGDLCRIVGQTIARIAHDPKSVERAVRVTALGALDGLPDELRRTLKHAEEATAERAGMHVQVAVGYGGRQEITDALRGLLEERHAHGDSLETVIAYLTPE